MPLGEFEFLKWIFKELDVSRAVIGPGDDCAAISAGRGLVLVSTDMLLEGTHFDSDDAPEAIGGKTIAVSLSDAAAMGVRPEAVVAAAAFRRPTERAFAEKLVRGMARVCAESGVELVGGDVTSWDGPLALSSTVLALAAGMENVVKRSTASAGDIIYVTGALGGSRLGGHLSFKPRIEEGVFLAENGFASSMIDVSDGLARDVANIAHASGAGAAVEADKIPVSDAARTAAESSGRTALEHAIGDGEDFELLFTARPAAVEKLEETWPFETALTRIGEITENGVFLVHADGGREPLGGGGYEHTIG